jgi:hypothetical protein
MSLASEKGVYFADTCAGRLRAEGDSAGPRSLAARIMQARVGALPQMREIAFRGPARWWESKAGHRVGWGWRESRNAAATSYRLPRTALPVLSLTGGVFPLLT